MKQNWFGRDNKRLHHVASIYMIEIHHSTRKPDGNQCQTLHEPESQMVTNAKTLMIKHANWQLNKAVKATKPNN